MTERIFRWLLNLKITVMKTRLFIFTVLCIALSACEAVNFESMKDMGTSEDTMFPEADAEGDAPGEEGPGEGEGDSNGNSLAGMVTAGEWNDLDNWDFWCNLIYGQHEERFSDYLHYWSLYPLHRYAVTVTDTDNKPVCGAKVELLVSSEEISVYDEHRVIWTTISDNLGSAELWYNISSDVDTGEVKFFAIAVDGALCKSAPQATFSNTEIRMNTIEVESKAVRRSADIAFIVDATGSMWDEIAFLKDDLLDIIQKIEDRRSDMDIRTAALFYRDEGDDYVTRYENFTNKPEETLDFIKEQGAAGGGDYPEAVHTALETAMQELAWEEGNYSRLAFLLLDAPPHYQNEVFDSIRKSIRLYAAKGIKIIPVAASGVDKNTEFLLRMMAMFTDGTYTFITNHSGIGNDHLTPTIGEYQVELLNDLIVRLVTKYTE